MTPGWILRLGCREQGLLILLCLFRADSISMQPRLGEPSGLITLLCLQILLCEAAGRCPGVRWPANQVSLTQAFRALSAGRSHWGFHSQASPLLTPTRIFPVIVINLCTAFTPSRLLETPQWPRDTRGEGSLRPFSWRPALCLARGPSRHLERVIGRERSLQKPYEEALVPSSKYNINAA